MPDSNRVRAIRQERGCGLYEAVKLARREEWRASAHAAETIADLKAVVLDMIEYIG